ncbi:MAG TPA: ATP-binding protein [Stenomitos sp.]
MTFDLFMANLFNATGIGLVLAVSIILGRAYPAHFFRHWTLAYLSIFGLIGLELFAPGWGRPPALTILESALIASGAWLFTQTGGLLRGRGLPGWSYWLTVAGCALSSGLLLSLGIPFTGAAAGPLLLLTAAYFWLGGYLVTRSMTKPDERHYAFGWFVILNGLLPATFPVLARTPYSWVGYWAAGVSHLLVGIGMIVSLLEAEKQAVQRQNEELQQLDRLKNEFLGTVTHELRTPLTAIKGATWVLEQDRLSPQQGQMVRMVAHQADRLGRLISDVLDYTKLDSGTMRYQFELADVGELIERTVSGYAPIFAGRGIRWSLELASEPLPARFDPDKLTQVFVNLLSNALKFTPEGGEVTFRARRESDEIRLEVRDTGSGIPPEELDRIFTRFYQVDGGNARPADGSGLGLAICRAIVEEGHQGRIWAQSRVGEGSSFFLSLPAAATSAQPIGA